MSMRQANGLKLLVITIFLAGAATTARAQEPITVFLAGDSTMAEKLPTKRPETGWGEFLQRNFDETRLKVENRAKNGRSTRTFISEGLWQQIVDATQPGDYVFIQFGHNDESKEKTTRYTPPDDFRANLTRMITDVRRKHANPVLLTPVMRRRFSTQGDLVDSHGEYPDIVRSVAAELKAPLIDMHRASAAVLKQYGDEPSRKLFLQMKAGEDPNYPNGVEDNTHFNPVGAQIMCGLAIKSIRDQELGIAKYLKSSIPEQESRK
jgi:lysophospholipase L1-like esterase